jgi:hypothetical protein
LIDLATVFNGFRCSPGGNFNNEFNHSIPQESDNKDVCIGYYVYIYYSKGNDYKGDDNRDDDKDDNSD